LIVIARAILIGNHLLRILKGIVGSDGNNRILVIRISFYRADISRCYAVPVKTSYGHVLPPPEAKGS
jgi:hypothetical protein